jgi:hypothetical protein
VLFAQFLFKELLQYFKQLTIDLILLRTPGHQFQ